MQHEELEKKLLDQMVEHLHAKEKEFREEIEKKVRVIAIVLWFEITELIVEQHSVLFCVFIVYYNELNTLRWLFLWVLMFDFFCALAQKRKFCTTNINLHA